MPEPVCYLFSKKKKFFFIINLNIQIVLHQVDIYLLSLQRVFHGIRLLRLMIRVAREGSPYLICYVSECLCKYGGLEQQASDLIDKC